MKDVATQMLKLCLLCFFIAPMLVISAPSPMFGKLKNKLSSKKGKEKVGESSNIAQAEFRVDPSAGMEASKLFRDHHRNLVASSRQAIDTYGNGYYDSLKSARKIITKGYKPGPEPATINGGSLKPLEVKSLTGRYSKSIREHADHASTLKIKQHALKGPIAIYHKAGLTEPINELEQYRKDLQALKFKWRNLPHDHRSIANLDLVHQGHNEAALAYLDNEIASVAEILSRHGIRN